MDSRLFHLNELASEAVLADFQHRTLRAIDLHDGEQGFPSMADHGISRDQLDSYLFDRQAILDFGGSPRTRNTVAGALIILPVLALSAVPERQRPGGEWAILVAVGIGLLLFLAYLIIMRVVRLVRLRRLDREQPECATFVSRVNAFSGC